MAEMSKIEGLVVGLPAVFWELEKIATRPALARIWGREGSLGAYIPTRKEWQSGRVEMTGRAIMGLLSRGVELNLHATTQSGKTIPRRALGVGRWSDLTCLTRVNADSPLVDAQVTKVHAVKLGAERVLPILGLTDLEQANSPEYALTLPDMAHYMRTGALGVTGRLEGPDVG